MRYEGTRMRAATLAALAAMIIVSTVALGIAPALGNGGKGKRVVYRGILPGSERAGTDVQFDAEIEPLLFRLTAVSNRYRVVRVRIRNSGTRPIVLSAAGDTVEVQFRSGSVLTALLDLGARDAQIWDRLPADVRNAIVYPRGVQGGEEEHVFVFFPVADVVEMPVAFRYTLASRPDRPVVIRDVSTAVAH
jgi:hypothetical protein